MKRIVWLALVALALPLSAFATEVDFGNSGGTLTAGSTTLIGSSNTLSLSGSELTQVTGFNGMGLIQGQLGSISFTTGTLMSGNMMDGATFGSGGTFVIMGNGTGGLPDGVLFSGTFTGNTTWTPTGTVGVSDSIFYTLSGAISGTWYNGTKVTGATTQITFDTGKNGFMGSVSLGSGNTVFTVTPEPGTLGLLGTGLVGLAGIVRKKYKN
ncbi:MAG: PEP-CTERM sorting domain-containing protein [Candidatus Sulfotelmatobacter sp.]